MKTKKKLIQVIYYNQISHSKTRGHERPSYTLDELNQWFNDQPHFDTLYNNWINSNCKRILVPSVDRLRDNEGYSLNNIRLVTFSENQNKSYIMHKKGELIFDHKAVDQYECIRGKRLGNRGATPLTKGKLINSFYSIMEAHRETNISFKNISSVCSNKRRHAGGYMWEYKC